MDYNAHGMAVTFVATLICLIGGIDALLPAQYGTAFGLALILNGLGLLILATFFWPKS